LQASLIQEISKQQTVSVIHLPILTKGYKPTSIKLKNKPDRVNLAQL